MCMFSQPKVPEVQTPPEYAQQREPDGGAIKDAASRRTTDRMRAATSTILTSGSGTTSSAPAAMKTLLGQ